MEDAIRGCLKMAAVMCTRTPSKRLTKHPPTRATRKGDNKRIPMSGFADALDEVSSPLSVCESGTRGHINFDQRTQYP